MNKPDFLSNQSGVEKLSYCRASARGFSTNASLWSGLYVTINWKTGYFLIVFLLPVTRTTGLVSKIFT